MPNSLTRAQVAIGHIMLSAASDEVAAADMVYNIENTLNQMMLESSAHAAEEGIEYTYSDAEYEISRALCALRLIYDFHLTMTTSTFAGGMSVIYTVALTPKNLT